MNLVLALTFSLLTETKVRLRRIHTHESFYFVISIQT